jgi:hypothetical protein
MPRIRWQKEFDPHASCDPWSASCTPLTTFRNLCQPRDPLLGRNENCRRQGNHNVGDPTHPWGQLWHVMRSQTLEWIWMVSWEGREDSIVAISQHLLGDTEETQSLDLDSNRCPLEHSKGVLTSVPDFSRQVGQIMDSWSLSLSVNW